MEENRLLYPQRPDSGAKGKGGVGSGSDPREGGGGGGGGWRFLPCMAGWNCLRAWARFSAACMALNGRSLGPGGLLDWCSE